MIYIRTNRPIETTKKNKRWLSPTTINAYLRCPRNFYYSKIAKLKQKPNIYLIRGIAVHRAIEKFYKFKINQCANMDYSDLRKIVIDLLKDEWLNQKKSLLELKLKKDDIGFYFQESRKMILNFLHDFLKGSGFEKPAPITEKMLFSKKYMLLGKIDAIYTSRDPPFLVDFKTCKSKEIIDDYKRQLACYALLYKEHFQKKPTLGIHFLKFKNGLRKFQITNQHLGKTKALVMNIHHKTQSENISDYPCTCGWCDKNFKLKSDKKT